jgi:hypothetical protein
MIKKIRLKLLNINHLKFKIIVNISLLTQWICLLLSLFFLIEMTVFDFIVAIVFVILSFRFYDFSQSYTRYYWKRWNDYQTVAKPNRFVRRKVAQKMKKKKAWH